MRLEWQVRAAPAALPRSPRARCADRRPASLIDSLWNASLRSDYAAKSCDCTRKIESRCLCYIQVSCRWRDGRVAEGARLESVFRGNSNVGSNPTLSAIHLAKLLIRLANILGHGLYRLFSCVHIVREIRSSCHCHALLHDNDDHA